ncbi:hypothetical protein Tco_1385118 [Tanacetum coccineum]
MPNPEDISDLTTSMNMALVLIAKAFKLNQSTLTNNNQRISSNLRNKQIIARNQNGHNAVQNIRNRVVLNEVQNPGVHNVGNYNGLIVVLGIAPPIANQNANHNGNGNVVAAQAKQASTSGTQFDKAPIYNLDGSSENNSNVTSVDSSVEQSGGTVQQHIATVEETHAHYESLFNNLAVEVEKVNMVNHKLKVTNADLTTELARYKDQEKNFEINKAKFDELETGYRKSVYQEQSWVVVTGVRGVRGVRLVLFSIGGDVHVGGVFRTWHRLCVSGGGLRRLLRWTTLGSGNNGLWVALPGLGWGGLVEGVCRRGLLCSAHERWKLFTFQDGGFIVGTLKFRRGRHGVPSWVTSRGLVVQVVKYAARGVTLSGVAQVLGFSEDGRTKSSRCLIERAKLPIVASGCDEALLEWLAEM